MEIKVVHACGSKFAFDIEPENGAMPFAIQCPNCGADATADANAIIAQALAAGASAAPPPPPPKPGLSLGHSAPAAPPPPPPPKPGLSSGRSHAAEAAAPPPPPPAGPAAAAPAGTNPHVAQQKGLAKPEKPLLPRALAGAVAGGGIALGIWYLLGNSGLIVWGILTKLLAWGTGVLIGYGVRLLGRVPNMQFGIMAGGVTLAALAAGLCLASWAWQERAVHGGAVSAYLRERNIAQSFVSAKDDDALRKAIAFYERKAESTVSETELAKVKDDLPRLKEFLGGKPSREQRIKELSPGIQEKYPVLGMAKASLGIGLGICALLGISSAFKIGSGKGS